MKQKQKHYDGAVSTWNVDGIAERARETTGL